MNFSSRRGFTLIEVLLVVVIIAILAGIVIIAVNPARQIAQTNNAQRDSDVRAVLDAVHQYSVDNRGVLPTEITDTPTVVGSGVGQIDICTYLVPTYVAEMPFDPTATGAHYTDCTDYDTGYSISASATDGRITVSAVGELSETISVTR